MGKISERAKEIQMLKHFDKIIAERSCRGIWNYLEQIYPDLASGYEMTNVNVETFESTIVKRADNDAELMKRGLYVRSGTSCIAGCHEDGSYVLVVQAAYLAFYLHQIKNFEYEVLDSIVGLVRPSCKLIEWDRLEYYGEEAIEVFIGSIREKRAYKELETIVSPNGSCPATSLIL